ncbi:universal stress protein [Pseudonocardia sp. NPDC049154]|uniref:universal stress protein n=1 Tax=Pseudonocardia sp. NPDC049154 TaxID=3155501 RepID=UPI0033DA7352
MSRNPPSTDTQSDRASTVVVGTDTTPACDVPVAYALREAARRRARLLVLTILDVTDHPNARYVFPDFVLPSDALRDSARQAAEQQVNRVAAGLPEQDRPSHLGVTAVVGSPARELVRIAHDADLLIVGRRRSGVRELVLGTTAIGCVLHAACPVTVVTTTAAAQPAPQTTPPRPLQKPDQRSHPTDQCLGRPVQLGAIRVRTTCPSTSIPSGRATRVNRS